MKSSPGEAQITPQMMQQVTPDVVSPQGKQQLFQHLGRATVQKEPLDNILTKIAQSVGADFQSRIKNAQTVVQKIAQKRIEGRDYNIDDINDPYGGRIIVSSEKQIPEVIDLVKKLADQGAFKILKNEDVRDDTYHAHHIDLETPGKGKAEIQIMEPQEHLESVVNHGIRATFGQQIPDPAQTLKDKQAGMAKKVSDNQAKQTAGVIQNISKQNNNQPIDPRIVAQLLQKAV